MTNGHLRALFQRSFQPPRPATAIPNGTVLTSRQQGQAALAAALAKARAAQIAQRRDMTPDQLEAFEAFWQRRTERAMRAKEAQRDRRRTRHARADNPAPPDTNLWAKAMSLQAATDTRLTMGARTALQAIRSLTARNKRVSRGGLAVLLGVSPRTVQRYLFLLKDTGYIRTRLIANHLGWVVGQEIEITEKVLPKHHRPKTAPTLADGLARYMSRRDIGERQGETVSSPSKSKYQNITAQVGQTLEVTMKLKKYEYGSDALRRKVQELRATPSPYSTSIRSTAVSRLYMANSSRFIIPITEYISGELGARPKGTRADTLILDDLRTAITTGRASIDIVREVLAAMFGEGHAGAWDADFVELADLFVQTGK